MFSVCCIYNDMSSIFSQDADFALRWIIQRFFPLLRQLLTTLPQLLFCKVCLGRPQHPHIQTKIYWPPETPHLLVSCQGPSKMYSPQEVSQSFEICLSFCLLANNKLDPGAIGQNLFLAQIAKDDSIIYDYLYLMAFSYVWCLAGID